MLNNANVASRVQAIKQSQHDVSLIRNVCVLGRSHTRAGLLTN